MTKLIIFGAGKVAEAVFRVAVFAGGFDVVAFTCDAEYVPERGTFCDRPVVSFEHVAARYPSDAFAMIVAVGYQGLNTLRRAKCDAARAQGYTLATLVSPHANVGDWLDCGDNCIILDGATVEPGTRIGNNVVIWSGALIGHHTVIEDDCWIAGHAVFGGSARLGRSCFVGLSAVIANEVVIGDTSFIGARTLVTACAEPKSVFITPATEPYRLKSDAFLKISKMR